LGAYHTAISAGTKGQAVAIYRPRQIKKKSNYEEKKLMTKDKLKPTNASHIKKSLRRIFELKLNIQAFCFAHQTQAQRQNLAVVGLKVLQTYNHSRRIVQLNQLLQRRTNLYQLSARNLSA
jgi:hypothetical protein